MRRMDVITFDIRVETPKGVLWCANITRNNNEVTAGSSDNQLEVEEKTASKKELQPALITNIDRAHAILGHAGEDATQKMMAVLNMLITRGGMKSCKSCAVAKAKQMDINGERKGKKAQVFNGRMFYDIATLKMEEGGKNLCHKSIWHICVDELVEIKHSNFLERKRDMPTYMCELMQIKAKQGHPILVIRQDNVGENKTLLSLAHSKEWKLPTSFENTAHKTPQQKSKAETGFTAAKARAMLSAAQVLKDEQYKMWGEVAKTATALDYLIAVTVNGVTKTRYEHAGLDIPGFVKYLRTFGEKQEL